MAGTTGLEPATSDVTGRRSNQLSYVPALVDVFNGSMQPWTEPIDKVSQNFKRGFMRRLYGPPAKHPVTHWHSMKEVRR